MDDRQTLDRINKDIEALAIRQLDLKRQQLQHRQDWEMQQTMYQRMI